MSNKEMKTRIVHKHDIEKHWNNASNFYPYKGEIIIYDIETGDGDLPEGRTAPYTYERIKIGDGVRLVKDLPFASVSSMDELIEGVETWIFYAGNASDLIDPLAPQLVENEAGGYTAEIG